MHRTETKIEKALEMKCNKAIPWKPLENSVKQFRIFTTPDDGQSPKTQ
jgi:hypothetical protein